MAVELKDIEQVAEEFGKKFDEFKSKNDKRLEGIEAEKSKLAGTVDSLNEKLSEYETYKKQLEDELAALKRPGVTGAKSKEVVEHKAAFGTFIRKGTEDGLRELEQKALSIGTDADGGYAVPEELDRTLIEVERDMSPMRQLCNQISISTSDYKKLVNLGGAASGWVGETAARSATGTPTLAQIVAFMGEIYANPQATQTSLDDMFFDAEAWLTDEVAYEFAQQEGAAFMSGNGTNKPKGILAYTLSTNPDATRTFGEIQKVHSGVAGDFDADDLINLIYSLKAGYRRGARFMMPQLTVGKVRTLKDGNGAYIWQPGLQLDQPSTLLGYGIAENEDVPAVAADANAMTFGNYNRGYTIVDRIGTRVLRDPYTNKPNVGFYTTKRVGGMVTDSNAIKVLTLSV
ncbi:phage major capsid protein [Marinobacterium lutimaris]|uniref:Phage major capsid protein, HK97 family n=1 Tax=Marinobacterium lutimaris TaxID=568106 RepID=A0A1H5Y937_9GAMM|nr:phage major capsid protein [Marinobacterium lutimaris]SEG20521.1 phage major capsid protein, HK97 family [Marinobacterium lutimaris]